MRRGSLRRASRVLLALCVAWGCGRPYGSDDIAAPQTGDPDAGFDASLDASVDGTRSADADGSPADVATPDAVTFDLEAGVGTRRVVSATLQTCIGGATSLAPGASAPLTCNVTLPVGVAMKDALVVPELYVAGNGCIVTAEKPRVVPGGTSFAVTASFTNRCVSGYAMSEGGLGWIVYELGPSNILAATPKFTGAVAGTFASCTGPAGFMAAGTAQDLRCDVNSPLGGNQMLVLPEMYVPGNGCIVPDSPPRVVMNGNNLAVEAPIRNRCATSYSASEGGMAWIVFERGAGGAAITISGVVDFTAETCAGSTSTLAPDATSPLVCNVSSTLGGSQIFITPETWMHGNGCIVTSTKPQTQMVGNNFGVGATLQNRCATATPQAHGGLAWIAWHH